MLKIKDKEIERLNKDLQTAIDICNNRQKEIVRLNNIINELEKWLNDNENPVIHYDYESKYDYIYVDNILDKLKELKEDK